MNRQPSAMDRVAKARPAVLDPRPDPERRLADLARALAEPSTASSLDLSDSRPSRWARARPRRNHLILGLAAATVAAVAVAVATVGSSAPEPAATDAPASSLDASRVLLVAADHVAAAPATGRYWRTRTEIYSLELAGPAKDPYVVRSVTRMQDWVARSDSDSSWGGQRSLGREPVSAADRAAWRRDGSPTTLAVRESSGDDAIDVPAAGTGWDIASSNSHGDDFFVGHDMTMSAIRALPADLTRLREFLMTDYQRNVEASRKFRRNGSWTEDSWLFDQASSLLTLPVAPQVRASAYRIMANVNGVRSLGRQPDLTGRVGDAVAVQGRNQQGLFERRIIIDPDSGLMMADEIRYLKPTEGLAWVKPTDVWQSTVITAIGWTDDKPPASTR